MNIARVFPRRTNATPDDELAFVNCPPPMLVLPEVDEVHVSVAFSWDIPAAEWLADQWKVAGVPVKMGGPALNDTCAGNFTPGMYIKPGYTFTSRGCNNKCWFCDAWRREGPLRELPITEGWNILDNNILGCSDGHINAVFDMLATQKRRPEFTGGLEAKILKPWHVERFREVKARRMYFAYDTPDDYEPLVVAGRMLREAGFKINAHSMACYVLIGWQGDTIAKAEKRLMDTVKAGFYPYAMLYHDKVGETEIEWRRFQREWLLPRIVGTKMREVWREEAHNE